MEHDQLLEQIGGDYDFSRMCECTDPGYTLEDVRRIFAVHEGQSDGEAWHWIVMLNDGRVCLTIGSCDYTGWDCQAGSDSTFVRDLEEAAKLSEHSDELLQQLIAGRRKTWEELNRKALEIRAAMSGVPQIEL